MNDSSARLVFVVDSDPEYGRGHLSRCLLLAEALTEQKVGCRFLLSHSVEMTSLAKYPITLFDDVAFNLNEIHSNEIVVVDGYRFKNAFLEHLKAVSRRLVVIDDLGDRIFPAHAVLNHNIYAESLDYSLHQGAELFLGPRYALVREEFYRLRGRPYQGKRILVTLGSSPLALKGVEIAQVLSQCLKIDVEVVLGANSNPPYDIKNGIRCHQWADLSELIERSSVVICGLGVTFLEVLASGRQVIGVQVASNQSLAYQAALAAGYAVFDHLDANKISQVATDIVCQRIKEPVCPFQLDSLSVRRTTAAVLGRKY